MASYKETGLHGKYMYTHELTTPTGQNSQKRVNADIGSSKVHFDVVSIQVDFVFAIVEDRGGNGIPRVTRHLVSEHEDDVRIGHSLRLHDVVNTEDIAVVTVVKPKLGRRNQHGPVVCVRPVLCRTTITIPPTPSPASILLRGNSRGPTQHCAQQYQQCRTERHLGLHTPSTKHKAHIHA